MSDRFAFIDVETTGGKASRDRITEVAVRIIEGGQQVDEWQSLVNPCMAIPPFIQRLTGIDNEMVAGAPEFHQLAEQLESLTKGCVFVAHNARFDYAFFKAEFRRLGRAFSRRTLCTVKLAKRLYPEFRRHSMDALIARHGIQSSTRHRAMADVDAMLSFFRIAEQEHGDRFANVVHELLGKPSLPAAISQAQIDALPEKPGVYRFYGENRSLLYVGKSVNIRQRVCSHFSSDHSSEKEMTLARSVRHIEFNETYGELGALLLEIEQIKTMHPVYNRRSRASAELFTFNLKENESGYLQCQCVELVDSSQLVEAFGLYRSRSAASRALAKVSQDNDLCNKLLGLEQADNACFAYQTGQCGGACVAKEDPERFNLRMQIAFHALKIPDWPYPGPILITEHSKNRSDYPFEEERADQCRVYLFDQWCLLGSAGSDEALQTLYEELSGPRLFDQDVYLVIKKFLRTLPRGYKVKEITEIESNHLGALF